MYQLKYNKEAKEAYFIENKDKEFMGFIKFIATHKITFNTLLNSNKTSSTISKNGYNTTNNF